jgi:pyruvate dehydrogenase kinase 2/3/4
MHVYFNGFQALRATRLKHAGASVLPPIRATISTGENMVAIRISDEGMCCSTCTELRSHRWSLQPGGGLLIPQITSPSDLFSFSHLRNSTRMEDSRLGVLRSMSLSTQGITATVKEQLNTMSQAATKETPDRIAPHPRIGIGLPMSNIFATFVFFIGIAVSVY